MSPIEAPPGHVCTVAGSAITATWHYITRNFGESSLDRVVAELSGDFPDMLDLDMLLAEQPDEQAVIRVRFLVRVMEQVGERYLADAGGAPELAERIGVFAAYEAQPILERMAINLSSPLALVRRAAQLWGHFYNCGRLEASQTGDRTLRATLEGFHAAHPLWCRRLTGLFRELLRRSSGRRARLVETRCVTSGAPVCEWEGDWSGARLF